MESFRKDSLLKASSKMYVYLNFKDVFLKNRAFLDLESFRIFYHRKNLTRGDRINLSKMCGWRKTETNTSNR